MQNVPDLSADVRALLTAVRDAIDLPIGNWAEADERAHHELLTARATVVRIILEGILDKGHDIPTSTAWLANRTADSPVTYTVWTPRDTDRGQR